MTSITAVLPVLAVFLAGAGNHAVSAVPPVTTVAPPVTSSKAPYTLVSNADIDAKIINMTTLFTRVLEMDVRQKMKNDKHPVKDELNITDDLIELGQDFIHNKAKNFYIRIHHAIADYVHPSPPAERIYNKVVVAWVDKINMIYSKMLAKGKID